MVKSVHGSGRHLSADQKSNELQWFSRFCYKTYTKNNGFLAVICPPTKKAMNYNGLAPLLQKVYKKQWFSCRNLSADQKHTELQLFSRLCYKTYTKNTGFLAVSCPPTNKAMNCNGFSGLGSRWLHHWFHMVRSLG